MFRTCPTTLLEQVTNGSLETRPETIAITPDTFCHTACVRCSCAPPAAATVNAAPFELPPLVEPATAEHHVGKVIWLDPMTPDLAGAKQFYSGLFGWTFRDIHTGKTDYAVAYLDGQPVGGVFQPARPRPTNTGTRRG